MVNIGDNFRAIRRALVLSRGEMAHDLGVNVSYISLIENGKKVPSKTIVILLKHIYSINEEWWLTGVGTIQKVPDQSTPYVAVTQVSIEELMGSFSEADILKIMDIAISRLRGDKALATVRAKLSK